MPLYEFECHSCGEKFEKLVRFSESTQQIECPQCSGTDTRKRFSLIASASINGGRAESTSTGGCGSRGGFT